MRIIWAFIGFLSVLFLSIPDAQSAASPQNQELVRVRLMTINKKIQLTGMSLKFQNLAQPFRPVAIPQNGQAEVRLLEKNGKYFWALRLNNQEREHLFTEKYLMVQGEDLRVGAQSLPARVLLTPNGNQKVDVIGVVPLDEYIVGVLSSEMPTSWPMETLKAQAVAIRSYTLAVIEERKDRPYHVESSVMDQVFRHVMGEDENDAKVKRAIQAVADTQGIRLYGPNEKVLKAFYHADCGGKTTTAKNVWKGGVDAGVAVDSSCPTGPHAQWNLKMTKEDLKKRLHLVDFTSLALVKAKGDSRVQSVQVAMTDGTRKMISANDFRQAMGYQDLRSTSFDIKEEGDQVVFSGRGFGHGVGLCQWGSRVLGQRGAKFQEILKHYYPLARLK
ncbi:SpoIID/LytB domain-containing protein [Bdellovibrio svalbardensis]|uniref:SpoIID/LytB domain-containing protein n=1 Tax=Bdellovibrio svalbardensis TaxID=2972972 RepID=A0ABT6DHA6_9BACT|nr:SpoIID/LytB domain-containing protein [Bdellovibrio svalbardensis]MDG0816235.1 SpoIID/LytB domain-containing protein [Bdellovibrio svalbardensis]